MKEFIENALEPDFEETQKISIQNMVEIHYSVAQQLYDQGEYELGDEHVEEAYTYAQNLGELQ